ncbi:MAG: hypothetical protein ACE5HQ_02555 [Gemmatimonadota bacterium]
MFPYSPCDPRGFAPSASFVSLRKLSAARVALIIPVLAAPFLSAGCRSDAGGGAAPEELFSESPATWFESFYARAEISPDGGRAIYGSWRDRRLVDLETGQVIPGRLTAGLDTVTDVRFDAHGELVRLGRRGDEAGWFAGSGDDLRLLPLPADAIPRWPPDGGRVAYVRAGAAERGLFVGPMGKATAYPVDGRITGYAWQPDGSAILVLSADPNGVSTLWRLNPDSGELSALARDLDSDPDDAMVAVSADGRLAYLALAGDDAPTPEERQDPEADRDFDIYAVNLETGAREPVVQTPAEEFAPAVAQSHLYWTVSETHAAVVVLPSDGGEARAVQEGALSPYWRPDGRRIGFTYGLWRLADWVLDWEGGAVDVDEQARPVSGRIPMVSGYHEDFSPVWSPDASWIAYHSHRSPHPVVTYAGEGSTDDIYLRRPGALMSEEIRLTDFGWETGSPDWSPDGTRLVFTSWTRGGARRASRPFVVRIDPDTGRPLEHGPVPLAEPLTGAETVAWSPSGDELAFEVAAGGGRHGIWVGRVDGSMAERLVEYPMLTYGGLDWTPDGSHVIYAALEGNRMQLFSVSRAGGEPRRLTVDAANLFQPQVSADGRWIAATRVRHRKAIRRRRL